VAHLVWDRFGCVPNYVEPFAGSLAVLLKRPHEAKTETVNDRDCYLANFWRALKADPAGVAEHADWPVNEADLHARHRWLHAQSEFRKRMETDPEFFDVKIAGYWVWGLSAWIGDNWCRVKEQNSLPNLHHCGHGVHAGELKRPAIGGRGKNPNYGNGVHKKEFRSDGTGLDHRRPHLTKQTGVHQKALAWQMPMLAGPNDGSTGYGNGVHQKTIRSNLATFLEALAERLRYVRVCCGDWSRVVKPSVCEHNGLTAVFLDPPYGVEDRDKCYNHDSLTLSADVRKWAIENGKNPKLRIALCGYEGEHQMPADWECVAWKAAGGYANQNEDRDNENCNRERIWFSPHCLSVCESLF